MMMRNKPVIYLMVLALLFLGGAAQAVILVSPGSPGDGGTDNPAVKNGGFESPPAGQTAEQVDDWFNYGTQTTNIRTYPPVRTGTWAGITSWASKPVVSTGYTITNGNEYYLSFWYIRSATTGVPTMNWALCYYADEGTPGFDPLTATPTDLFTAPTTNALTDTWQQEVVSRTIDGSHSAAFGKTLYLRFFGTAAGSNPVTQGRFDDVVLSVASVLEDFGPPNGAVNVPVTGTTLSWVLNTAAVDPEVAENPQYRVYFSKNQALVDANDISVRVSIQTGTVYPETGYLSLEYSSETNPEPYYWKIILFNNISGAEVYQGPTLHFLTETDAPLITLQPESITTDQPTATLTIQAIRTKYYDWYRNGSFLETHNNDTGTDSLPVTIGADYSGEAKYYCFCRNDGTGTDTSGEVFVMAKRLVGHWKLDNDLTDSVQATVTGAPVHNLVQLQGTEPNFVADAYDPTEMGTHSMELFNSDDPNEDFYAADGSGDSFDFYPQGFTASGWVKTTTSTLYKTVIAKQNPAKTDGWALDVINTVGSLTVRGYGELRSTIDVNDGQWHWLVGTYDKANSRLRLYVDGELDRDVAYTATLLPNQAGVTVGSPVEDNTINDALFDGRLDDLKVWSYPRSAAQVAQDWYDITEEWTCVDEIGQELAPFDVNGDCRVSLEDFAEFAASWLNCNRVPASEC